MLNNVKTIKTTVKLCFRYCFYEAENLFREEDISSSVTKSVV